MNCLDKLTNLITYKQKKQKGNFVKGFAVFSVIGIAIGGVVTILLSQTKLYEKKDPIISNYKDSNEDINIKRDEIKQTLEEFGDEFVGDVGVAMEKALENVKDEKQNEIEE